MTDQTQGPPTEQEQRFADERAKVGDGWHRIIDELDDTLRMLLADDYVVLQIKEQYGGLRYYILLDHRYANLNIVQALRAINEAEQASWTTCEGCGEPGTLEYHAGWYKTLCPRHHEEVEDIMADAARTAVRNWLGVKA